MAAPDPTLRGSQPQPQASQAEIFRVFVSDAREDAKIELAVFEALRSAQGHCADVFIDNDLRFGLSFQDEIKSRLDVTDRLVVIYSVTLKPVQLRGNGAGVSQEEFADGLRIL